MKSARLFTFAGQVIIGVTLLVISASASCSAAHLLAPPARPYRNTFRVDFGGPLVLNLLLAGSNQPYQAVLPVLVGYERQLTPRITANVEGIVNGGFRYEKTTGLSLQGRYYVLQPAPSQAVGLYVAPTLAYRAIRQTIEYNSAELVVHSQVAGAGSLVGVQVPLGKRFALDVALGYLGWAHLHDDKTVDTDVRTYRELDAATVDGRFSVGYRF